MSFLRQLFARQMRLKIEVRTIQPRSAALRIDAKSIEIE